MSFTTVIYRANNSNTLNLKLRNVVHMCAGFFLSFNGENNLSKLFKDHKQIKITIITVRRRERP